MRVHWVVPVLASILILGVLIPNQNAFSAVFIDSFDVSGQDLTPTGVAFSADGLTMFVVGDTSDDVYEYACGAAFDVSTCAFTVKAGNPFSVSAQETDVRGLAFSTDGLKMFVTGFNGDEINEYACGAAFDVSTCAFTVKAGNPFSVAAQEDEPQDIVFSTDGLTMFVIGTTGLDVNEYTCGAAFDVSTCAFTVKAGNPFSVAAQEGFPQGLAFSTDGLKMFVTGASGLEVNEYACGAAFDVSTCAFTVKAGNPFSVAAQETSPTGLAFSTDGLTMFVIGAASLNVNEYALGIPFDVSSVPIPVGGTSIPIDQSALLLAGVQSISMWMIPVLAVGVVVGVFVIKRRN